MSNSSSINSSYQFKSFLNNLEEIATQPLGWSESWKVSREDSDKDNFIFRKIGLQSLIGEKIKGFFNFFGVTFFGVNQTDSILREYAFIHMLEKGRENHAFSTENLYTIQKAAQSIGLINKLDSSEKSITYVNENVSYVVENLCKEEVSDQEFKEKTESFYRFNAKVQDWLLNADSVNTMAQTALKEISNPLVLPSDSDTLDSNNFQKEEDENGCNQIENSIEKSDLSMGTVVSTNPKKSSKKITGVSKDTSNRLSTLFWSVLGTLAVVTVAGVTAYLTGSKESPEGAEEIPEAPVWDFAQKNSINQTPLSYYDFKHVNLNLHHPNITFKNEDGVEGLNKKLRVQPLISEPSAEQDSYLFINELVDECNRQQEDKIKYVIITEEKLLPYVKVFQQSESTLENDFLVLSSIKKLNHQPGYSNFRHLAVQFLRYKFISASAYQKAFLLILAGFSKLPKENLFTSVDQELAVLAFDIAIANGEPLDIGKRPTVQEEIKSLEREDDIFFITPSNEQPEKDLINCMNLEIKRLLELNFVDMAIDLVADLKSKFKMTVAAEALEVLALAHSGNHLAALSLMESNRDKPEFIEFSKRYLTQLHRYESWKGTLAKYVFMATFEPHGTYKAISVKDSSLYEVKLLKVLSKLADDPDDQQVINDYLENGKMTESWRQLVNLSTFLRIR